MSSSSVLITSAIGDDLVMSGRPRPRWLRCEKGRKAQGGSYEQWGHRGWRGRVTGVALGVWRGVVAEQAGQLGVAAHTADVGQLLC